MDETTIKKHKLLFELVNEVDNIKQTDEIIDIDFNLGFKESISDFERHNDKVFNINVYIITRLFKGEYEKIKEEKGKFTLEEYYEFIDGLDLPDIIQEYYIKMPQMVAQNKILSYVTDIPSYLDIIKG
ncbi:MAG: hypothetical protein J6J17_01805 [Bacilli bacterium]|nr:hypothetical protein [Bacilli bacterium]